ncbi:NAD(P)-binding protein [Bimuria novae-zelandiae CBS 107.79]|uniref:NAD(P)-binding protein n=1 Tax=Bimuria novae-zelandiae CBS 107.79 TaxID=1447943 RepID=A0A6A5VTW6_9PLEO|nr:NAD(P)-binding protein [Bimuria novae-zelandiae CBS 107.79]
MIQNVPILGATGTIGCAPISDLLQANFIITAITCLGSTQTLHHPNILSKEASYDDLPALTAALQNQHALIEAFNPSAAAHQATIIHAALVAGVQHVITLEFGPDTFNPHIDEVLVYAPKIAAQKALQKILDETKRDMTWTAIITGGWYDYGIENGLFWVDKHDKTITKFGTREQRYAISSLDQITKAVVRVLREPGRYENRAAYFVGHVVSTNQLIRTVKWIGREEWKVNEVALDGFLERGRELWECDSQTGVKNRLATPAYAMLGTVAFFDEENRYGGEFGEKVERGWD